MKYIFCFVFLCVLASSHTLQAETVEHNGYMLEQTVTPVNSQVIGNGYVATVQSGFANSESLVGLGYTSVSSVVHTPDITVSNNQHTTPNNTPSVSTSSGVFIQIAESILQTTESVVDLPIVQDSVQAVVSEYTKLGKTKPVIYVKQQIDATTDIVNTAITDFSHNVDYVVQILDSKISFGLLSLLAVIILIIAFGVSVLGYGAVPTILAVIIIICASVGVGRYSLLYLFPLLLSLYSIGILLKPTISEQISVSEMLRTDLF